LAHNFFLREYPTKLFHYVIFPSHIIILNKKVGEFYTSFSVSGGNDTAEPNVDDF
jgi:hypothetical protein